MSKNQTLSPLNWAGKKTHFLLDILETIRSIGASKIWDATTGSGTIAYFLSCQGDLNIFASDLDPILVRFHLSFSQGRFQENLYLQEIQKIKRDSPKETFDELRRLCNEDLLKTGSVNPYLYYLFNKLELYSLLKRKVDGTFGGSPKLSREITSIPCPPSKDEYQKITWFEYDYSSPDFEKKASEFDLVILDPPYWGQEDHYCKKDSNAEAEFQILSTCKNIIYFQVLNPFLIFFAKKNNYFIKEYQKRSTLSNQKRTQKEILLCTHPLAR